MLLLMKGLVELIEIKVAGEVLGDELCVGRHGRPLFPKLHSASLPGRGDKVDLAVRWVSPDHIRRLFNDHGYYERVLRGELLALVTSSNTPHPMSNQPPGTVSQTVVYFDGGEPIARVHQFVDAAGELRARPDPKYLKHDGVDYMVRSKRSKR